MKNRILLTGAGFSHNFGAPLAKEMSDSIFNDSGIQNNHRLRNRLQNSYDYENLYQEIMASDQYDQNEKKIFDNAIKSAYHEVDQRILKTAPNLSHTCSSLFKKLILPFAKPRGGSGFIFTLNQDLFIERKFDHYSDDRVPRLELPIMGSGMFGNDEALTNQNKRFMLDSSDFEDKKNQHEKKLLQDKIPLSYVKLHGSQEWYKDHSNQLMVIGNRKSEAIRGEPLLRSYFDLFKQALNKDGTKLLSIGYSFNDEHINRAIHNIDKTKKLEIYIIDPKPRQSFMGDLGEKPSGNEIAKLIHRYYSISILDLFPNDPIKNFHHIWEQLKRDYFDED